MFEHQVKYLSSKAQQLLSTISGSYVSHVQPLSCKLSISTIALSMLKYTKSSFTLNFAAQ